ncbi:copper resistance protein CopC, partial [Pseudonocardia pini]|uniref:copper resistance protein CopC n=1 Tax=Pseudonocardia pini TaxID=2758030 RepID=UPI0015F0EE76
LDLATDLAAGSYTVDWRLVDAAGAPRTGTFLFTLAPAVETAALTLQDEGAAWRRTPAPWLAGGLVLLVGGLALGRSATRPRR